MNKGEHFLKTSQDTVLALSVKAVKRLNVFPLQRTDNPGVSGGGYEISKDFKLFTKDEQVISKATENPVIQQQEQILGEFQILWTLLSKPVTVVLQVG